MIILQMDRENHCQCQTMQQARKKTDENIIYMTFHMPYTTNKWKEKDAIID